MIRYVIFPEGHKFYAQSEPDVYESRGRWIVRYRDHHTVKQDMQFDSEAAARLEAFEWRLVRGMFNADLYGGSADDVAAMWGLPVSYAPEVAG